MSWPPDVKERALVAAGRHCCICHRFCGIKIELHHIHERSSGGKDTFANCIPLCFDCHSDMKTYDFKHPKGTKYSTSELIAHRDLWYARVSGSPNLGLGKEIREADKKKFEELCHCLPWQPYIEFARDQDFDDQSFPWSMMQKFDDFVRWSQNANNEFLDADLEAARVQLAERVKKFVIEVATNTSPLDRNPDRSKIHTDYRNENSETYISMVKELNDAGSAVYEAYSDLIRMARQRMTT